ncbi:hypothetical protein BGZ61DRAFT_457160 [Ilyonectria robusta]|uniref:uncharacterized protein n=1 Tax=Ilyonectria robusta TaxID=1079257 RepID=UPI001E8CFEFF|nr:uncharacterized protein BGZ61DRAFT_457160 [Ilyonectria robusta]KAH8679438.1 hypothetical protein BGZ61DRAFT_457160 [Ilyonectria robusta]
MAEGLGQVVSWYVCTIVAFIFVVARLWIRVSKFGSLALEDGFIILATCCLVGDLAIQQYMWNLGMAEMGTASRQDFIHIMQMIVPGSILYVSSLWAIKIALVLFYKRLAARGTKLQIIYNVVLGLLAATWTLIFFHIIFQCFPHNKRWSLDPTYQCDPANANVNYWITILLNIFSDVIIISLPISMVLNLQMKFKQKLGVTAIFALGFFVVIASIIRAYYSKRNETMLTCTVSMVETAVAIIATCLPPLRTVLLGHSSSAGTGSNYGHYELSSAGHNRSRRTQQSRITTNIVGGTQQRGNDSEDELVKEAVSVASGAGGSVASGTGTRTQDKSGITVSTTLQMHHGRGDATRSEAKYSNFAY